MLNVKKILKLQHIHEIFCMLIFFFSNISLSFCLICSYEFYIYLHVHVIVEWSLILLLSAYRCLLLWFCVQINSPLVHLMVTSPQFYCYYSVEFGLGSLFKDSDIDCFNPIMIKLYSWYILLYMHRYLYRSIIIKTYQQQLSFFYITENQWNG